MKFWIISVSLVLVLLLGWLVYANRDFFTTSNDLETRITLQVSPKSAEVYIDGQLFSQDSPMYTAGKHVVSAFASGYNPFQKELRFTPETYTLKIILTAEQSDLPPEGAPDSL